jgi:UDPglucose 6-dehydrogenase
VWGLAFKANTNDMRESAAIDTIKYLLGHGAAVVAYDPLAVTEAQQVYLRGCQLDYETADKYDILNGCDALVICTETGEYRSIDFERVGKFLRTPVIFDGRNILDIQALKQAGFEYYGIGRGDKLEWQDIKLNGE